MIIDRSVFFQCQKEIGVVPFSQSEAWLDANVHDGKMVFYVDDKENPKICCYGNTHHQRLIGERLIINGLCMSESIDSDSIKAFLKSIRGDGYDVITISDISIANPSFEVGIRRAGFVRPFGLDLCPMSLWVDLQSEWAFHRNWKRNVKKSITAGNKFVHVENPTLKDSEDFVNLFIKMQDRKSLGYMITPNSICKLLNGPFDLFFIEDAEANRISGRIEYCCKGLVYDIYAANTTDGVNTGAAYHIQQGVFEYYKNNGATVFDYGRIPPSDSPMDNIYVAKRYSGGQPIIYNGQWVFSKSTTKMYIMSLNSFVRTKQRYY